MRGIREWRNLEIRTLFWCGEGDKKEKGHERLAARGSSGPSALEAQRRTPGIRDWRKPGLGRQDSYRRFRP